MCLILNERNSSGALNNMDNDFRCEALNFRISKSQKKILKRMTKILRNELTNDNSEGMDEDQQDNIGKIFRILICL